MKRGSRIGRAARQLRSRPDFLYAACRAIGSLGVVGENRNRLVVFLAGITKELDEPVSVMITGSPSSGKSNLLQGALRVFPPATVVERASLSGKAPAYSKPIGRKILWLQEYRGGKDAQYLIRQLQSEGRITHEATTVTGKKRGTQVARQIGKPVVLTTTTETQIFPDDATRFLFVAVDESEAQTLAVAKAHINPVRQQLKPPLEVWRRAISLIKKRKGDFRNPPDWLEYVPEKLPLGEVRVRRDWKRCLSFLQAIALCRCGGSKEAVNISFADYIVAYKILEPALAGASSGIHPQELQVLRAVKKLLKCSQRGVSAKAIADYLGWDRSVVYKYLELAAEHKRIEYEPGTRERNQKFVIGVRGVSNHFLPKPNQVLRHRKDLPEVIRFVDPFTGKRKRLTRK